MDYPGWGGRSAGVAVRRAETLPRRALHRCFLCGKAITAADGYEAYPGPDLWRHLSCPLPAPGERAQNGTAAREVGHDDGAETEEVGL
jgi:hypothetical protein